MTRDLSEIRRRAWETRRKKYGPRGNNGSYARPSTGPCEHCAGAVAMLIKLYVEGSASEGQVAKATGLHRIEIRKRADDFVIARDAARAGRLALSEGSGT